MVLSDRDIPAVAHGPEGLSVEGASPGLLRALLARWDDVIRSSAPATWATLRPGLPGGAVARRFEELGLNPPEEAIVWWTWRNGHEQVPHALRNAQMSLDLATLHYRKSSLGDGEGQWNPLWFPLAGEGPKWSIAMKFDLLTEPPLVRSVTPELGATTQGDSTAFQAVSMCTPVALWLHAVKNGWYRSNTETGWFDYHSNEIPEEWRKTDLV